MNTPRLTYCIALAIYAALPSAANAGYTHYFTWKSLPDKDKLSSCIADMKRLIASRGAMLAGPDGNGEPIVTEDQIVLNGVGNDAHEPFVFPGEDGFNSCKTQWKPYDDVVVACLFVARDYFSPKELEIGSDGESDAGSFAAGRRLYVETFARQPKELFSDRDSRANAPIEDGIGRWLVPIGLGIVVAVLVWMLRRR